MEKRKIKIGYINKTFVAGTLTFAIITAPLTGCARQNTNFITSTDEERIEGVISYDLLQNYYYVESKNNFGSIECHICRPLFNSVNEYIDVITGKSIYYKNIVREISLYECLATLDDSQTKEEYTADDMNQMLYAIKASMKEKSKVKRK